jgi:hypothetical protein
MKLLGSRDVMDIAAATGEEAPIFPAPKRYPNPIYGHCDLSSAFPNRSGAGRRRCDNGPIARAAAEITFEAVVQLGTKLRTRPWLIKYEGLPRPVV